VITQAPTLHSLSLIPPRASRGLKMCSLSLTKWIVFCYWKKKKRIRFESA